MAKKIKLIELDIDVAALTEKSANSRTEVQRLSETIRDLKKVQNEAQKEIDKTVQNLDKLEKANMGGSKAAEFLREKIDKNVKIIEESNYMLTEHEAQLKTARREYNLNTRVLQAYSDKTLQHLDIIKQTDGSIDQISAALSKNKEIYKSLSKEERENAEVGGMLLEIIQQQDQEYKDLHKSIGNTQVEVGNYKEQIKEALAESTFLNSMTSELRTSYKMLQTVLQPTNKIISKGTDQFKAMASAQSVTQKGTLALRGALILLSSVPIILLLTGIVAAVAAVYSWFTKTQKGADQLAKVMSGLSAILDVARDRFAKIGGILVELVTGQKSLFQAWREGKEAVAGMADEMERESEIAVKLEEKLQQIQKAEVLLDVQRAGQKRRLKELNLIAEDTSKSFQQRSDALQESARIEEELLQKTIDLGNQKLANQLREIELTEKGKETLERFRQGAISADEAIGSLGISESTLQDLEAFRDVFVEVENQQAEMLEIQTTRNNKYNQLLASRKAEEKAAADEAKRQAEEVARKREEAYQRVLDAQQKAIDKSKTELDIYFQTNVGIAASLQERVELERSARDKRLEILKEETELQIKQAKGDASEIANIKANAKAEELQITRDFLRAQADLTIENTQKELALWIASNKSKLEESNRLTDQLVNEEQSRINTIYQKKLENIEREKELLEQAGQFDYNKKLEYDQAKLNAEDEYQTSKRQIEINYQTQKTEDDKLNRSLEFEERLADLQEQNATEFEMQQELAWQNYEQEMNDLEQRYAEGKIAKENFEKEKALIEQQYAQVRKEINEAVEASKIEGIRSVLGQFKEVLGEQTAVGKAAAITETTIATYQSATQAYKSMAGIPVVGPALGAAAAGLAVAAGLENVKKIMSANPTRAAKGITLSGPSHAGGGINLYDQYGNHVVEAEGDENVYVLNKRASKEIAALSGWNQAFGGVSLSRNVHHAAAGGMIGYQMAQSGTTNVNSNVNLDAESMARSMMPFISEAVQKGAQLGTHSGSMVGIQEKRINSQIAASANHG